MTDAVNTGIVDCVDRSEKSLKNGLYPAGKKASMGSTVSAVLVAVTGRYKGKVDVDGKAGATASASASDMTHELLGGSGLEGVGDVYHTVKGASRAAKATGNRLNGKNLFNLRGSLKFAREAVGCEAISNALEGPELRGADASYDVGKATYHTVRGVKERLNGKDALPSKKSLGKLFEEKSVKGNTDTTEAERKVQAFACFKREVYSTVEEAEAAVTAAEGSVSIIRDIIQGLMASLGAVAALVLGIIIVLTLAIVLIITVISGGDEDSSNLGDLSEVQLEVVQALSDAGLGNPQIAVVVGNISEESDWNPTAEYHGADGEYDFGLFQFTDAPTQNVYNYTVFVDWCFANNKDRNNAATQTEYFMT